MARASRRRIRRRASSESRRRSAEPWFCSTLAFRVDRRTLGRAKRAGVIAAICIAVLGAMATPAPAHNTPWLFSAHQVLVRQGLLQWLLDREFTDLAPIVVQCHGLNPACMQHGGTGYAHIRCTTSLNIPDFIYHLDRRGNVFATRAWG
jgi:hypothetical protein